jgi:hypothetical protein
MFFLRSSLAVWYGKREAALVRAAARDADVRFSRHGQAMNAATREATVIAAKAPSSSQSPNAKGSERFSACEQNYKAIQCLAMPAKTHRGDAPIGRIPCRLGKILDVNNITSPLAGSVMLKHNLRLRLAHYRIQPGAHDLSASFPLTKIHLPCHA